VLERADLAPPERFPGGAPTVSAPAPKLGSIRRNTSPWRGPRRSDDSAAPSSRLNLFHDVSVLREPQVSGENRGPRSDSFTALLRFLASWIVLCTRAVPLDPARRRWSFNDERSEAPAGQGGEPYGNLRPRLLLAAVRRLRPVRSRTAVLPTQMRQHGAAGTAPSCRPAVRAKRSTSLGACRAPGPLPGTEGGGDASVWLGGGTGVWKASSLGLALPGTCAARPLPAHLRALRQVDGLHAHGFRSRGVPRSRRMACRSERSRSLAACASARARDGVCPVHDPRFSPVNFTEYPRFLMPANTSALTISVPTNPLGARALDQWTTSGTNFEAKSSIPDEFRGQIPDSANVLI
jgi:hypothetical protein